MEVTKKVLPAFLLLLLSGCNNYTYPKYIKTNEKDCIQRIITLDDSLGKRRNLNAKKISLSETISEYANALTEADFENCSPEFKAAFNNHREAWLHMKVITDKYPDMRGEMHVLFDQIKKSADSSEFRIRLDGIWNTWAEVEQHTGLP